MCQLLKQKTYVLGLDEPVYGRVFRRIYSALRYGHLDRLDNIMTSQVLNAFVLRMNPGGENKIKEALTNDELIIGWSKAKGLDNLSLGWENFREIVHNSCFPNDENYLRSGRSAGNLWRFIREMKQGDLVAVPTDEGFYVAEIEGEVRFLDEHVEEDTAYRRKVKWLNNSQPIDRKIASYPLISRMRIWHTCARANDLIQDISESVKLALSGEKPTFENDLREKLITQTLEEIHSGKIDDYGFERLVANLLKSLGGQNVRITPRNLDKGIDIFSDFRIAKLSKITLGVQAKHWQPKPPVGSDVVEQLRDGLKSEDSVSIGWIVTAGTLSEEAREAAIRTEEDLGLKIELIDGHMLASLIVEVGIGSESALVNFKL